MKRVYVFYGILGCLILFGCQAPDVNQVPDETFVLNQAHHELRMSLAAKPYWEAVNDFRSLRLDQQRGIWLDKIHQSLSLSLPDVQRDALLSLQDFLLSPRFLQENIRKDFLGEWGLNFQNRFGFFEGLTLTITFQDISSHHLDEDAGTAYDFLQTVGANSEEPQSEISKRSTNCNCSWGWSCSGTCDNWRCDDSAGGCGFLLLGDCEYLCDLTGGL